MGHAVIRARIGAVNARVGEYTVVAQTFTSQVSLEPAAVYKCREAVPFMLEKRDKQVPRVKEWFRQGQDSSCPSQSSCDSEIMLW